MRNVKLQIGVKKTFDNSLAKQVCGINFIPFRKTMEDMGDALIATGYVKVPKK